MKVYNEEKTKILEEYDLSKGYLKDDTLTTHVDAVEGVKEEGHYETIKEYPNGGKDVKWVVDVEKVEPVEEHDVEEPIKIYIPYSEEELQKIENNKLLVQYQQELSSTDYEAIKYAEGWFTDEEYAPIKAQREELREKIRKILDNKEV